MKVMAASGAAAGIEMNIRLTEQLPLEEVLSEMPWISEIERNGLIILIIGQHV